VRIDQNRTGGRWWRAAGALAVSALALCLVGFTLFAANVSRHSAGQTLPPVAPNEGIVVLTGGDRRIVEAIRLFDQRQTRRLLISGVHTATSREELRRRADLARLLFDCCVDIGYSALDTAGNAAEARAWAQTWNFRRLIVVTSNYHMPRSLIELSRAMPDVELLPFAVAPRRPLQGAWWFEPDALRIVAIEYVKTLPALARLGVARLRNRTMPRDEPRDALGAAAAAFVAPVR
jgi:uncharacterized SAM-binding protein YcdF (DUF218 family)